MVWTLVSTIEKYVGSEIFQRYRTGMLMKIDPLILCQSKT